MKILMFLILLCLLGCKDNTTESPILNENSSEIIPLKTGYYWVYDVSEYDSLKKEKKYEDTISVINSSKLNGVEYLSLNKFPNRSLLILFANKEDGVHTLWNDGYDYSYFIKYKGSGDLFYSITDFWSVEIIDTNLILSTKIGKCKVLEYMISLTLKPPVFQNHYYYIAPGIGLIKYEKYDVNIKNEKSLRIKMEIKKAFYK